MRLSLLAWRSAWNRRATLLWVVLSIALASAMLWSLERLRADLRSSFAQSVSGVDLIVGARTSPVSLMLFSVFHLGSVSQPLPMRSLEAVARHPAVAWTVPISLGDSHRGFPVLGTTPAYFEHMAYGDYQRLQWQQGRAFAGDLDGLYQAVIGAEVARQLGYRQGQRIVLSHGLHAPGDAQAHEADHDHDHSHGHGHGQGPDPKASVSAAPAGSGAAPALPGRLHRHEDKPFEVVGVLAPTGTPVDRTVIVSLQALEALHLDWAGGAPLPGLKIPADQARKFKLQPEQVTAAMVGLKSRAAVFNVQRFIQTLEGEALTAAMPAVTLDELWQVLGLGERALQAMSWLVALVSLLSLMAVVLASLQQRRRELAVLRAVGAQPRQLIGLLLIEGAWVTLAGVLLGVLLAQTVLWAAAPAVQAWLGVQLHSGWPLPQQWAVALAVLVAGVLASLWPAWRAYRFSLADGLTPKT